MRHGGDDAFPDDALDGGADEDRLIEERPDLEVIRQARLDLRNQGLDVGDDIERGDIAVLQDGNERGADAILPHDIGLRGENPSRTWATSRI